MKKLLCGLLLWGAPLAIAAPPATLDLTPRTIETASGFSRTYFNGDGKKFTVSLGADTDLTGSRDEATFRFTDLRAATVTLKLSSRTPKELFDEETLPAYRQIAATFSPPGVDKPAESREIPSPLPINDWTGYRIINTYRLPGNSIKQSITFLNLDKEQQLIVVTTAFENEFDETAQRGDALLQSWRSISEKELGTPSLN